MGTPKFPSAAFLNDSKAAAFFKMKPRKIDVRFVAATNRALEFEVQRGAFREDLFYRLNAVVIVVPPLRERTGEIAPLARMFVARAARELGLECAPAVDAPAMEVLERYPWPGNVRELKNVMDRAVLLAGGGGEITVAHLPAEKMGRVLPGRGSPRLLRTAPPVRVVSGPMSEPEERARVVAALAHCDGNQTHAAKVLGVSRRTLISRMEAYGLPRPRKRRADADE